MSPVNNDYIPPDVNELIGRICQIEVAALVSIGADMLSIPARPRRIHAADYWTL